MKLDIRGFVNSTDLPASKALLPLFEAISNSIHAIEERKKNESNLSGYITIKVLRDERQKQLKENITFYPVCGFEIIDNGIGFNEENYNSFDTGASLYKLNIGGKGLGRFMWLKSFDNIKIKSSYQMDKNRERLEFDFLYSKKGIENYNKKIIDSQEDIETVVYLLNYKPEFKHKCPKDSDILSNKIIEHFMEYFITDNNLQINILDGETKYDLHNIFKESLIDSFQEQFNIQKQSLKINHLKIKSNIKKEATLYLTGHKRAVKEFALKKYIPELSKKFKDSSDAQFNYIAFVSGKLLDNSLNNTRTDFSLPKKETNIDGEFSIAELIKKTIKQIEVHLNDFLTPIRNENLNRIKEYIIKKAPSSIYLIDNYEDDLKNIPPDSITKEEALNIELFKIKQCKEAEINEMVNKINKKNLTEDYDGLFNKYSKLVTELGKSKLAEYITHRKAVIDLFENCLRKIDGKYKTEDMIHNIIFPMTKTSNQTPYETQNLWIIDERLSFHTYLASDKQIRTMPVDSKSQMEPDLTIFFDDAFAYSHSSEGVQNSVVIIEFKRPGRNDYNVQKSPILQATQYIEEMTSRKVENQHGRTVLTDKNTRFHCYIICDIKSTLEPLIKWSPIKNKTTDGMGFYGYYNDEVYMEIISY